MGKKIEDVDMGLAVSAWWLVNRPRAQPRELAACERPQRLVSRRPDKPALVQATRREDMATVEAALEAAQAKGSAPYSASHLEKSHSEPGHT